MTEPAERSRVAVAGLGILFFALVAWLVVSWWGAPVAPPGGRSAGPHATEHSAQPMAATGANPRDQTAGRVTAEPSAAVTEGDEPPSYRNALGGLRGRLVWRGSRAPVVDTEVAVVEVWLDSFAGGLNDYHGSETREPALFRARTRTDLDGRFVLPGLHSRATLVLAIGLQTPAAAVRFIDQMPAPRETVDLGEVELRERGGVDGRVLDPDGKPVADKLDLIGRMGGEDYVTTRDRFTIERPD